MNIPESHWDLLNDEVKALKYTGEPVYASRAPGEVRVMYRISPERVTTNG
jgi:hypothetical protein